MIIELRAVDAPDRPPRPSFFRAWLSGPGVSTMWFLNLILLGYLVYWIWNDRGFMKPRPASIPSHSLKFTPLPEPAMLPMSRGRLIGLGALGAASAATFIGILTGLFLGSRRQRGLRAWLALFVLVALWLTVATSWQSIAWAGRCAAARNMTDVFERIAASLRDDWPTEDGSRDALGAFSAYPHDHPRMLMLLAPPSNNEPAQFSAIERSDAGGLRFELMGREIGAWLEWHPAGRAPASFVGGLDTHYQMTRSTSLGGGWHLTNYSTGRGSIELE